MSRRGRGRRARPRRGRDRCRGSGRSRPGRGFRGGDDARRPPVRLGPYLRGAQALDPEGKVDIVINVQGDLPTIDPAAIRAVFAPLRTMPSTSRRSASRSCARRSGPTRTWSRSSARRCRRRRLRALYFTRATAPWGDGPLYHHIGLYAYRRAALERFVSLPPSALERREKLEQLRALEAGMRIDAEIVQSVPLGVDTPEDLDRARKMLSNDKGRPWHPKRPTGFPSRASPAPIPIPPAATCFPAWSPCPARPSRTPSTRSRPARPISP